MTDENPRLLRTPKSQTGATLVIAMIFLVLLTLIVVSAIKVGNVNTKIVGNMQIQRESEAAGQHAIETTLGTNFDQVPPPPTVSVDISDSGQTASTYVVTTPPPVCASVTPIKQADPQLDIANAGDRPCFVSGAAQNSGIVGAGGNGNSLCSNSNWDVSATAAAPGVATTSTTTHQGVAMRVPVGSSC